jgi:uncharacterized protein DUF4349
MKRYGLGAVVFVVLAGLIGLLAEACTGGGSSSPTSASNAGAGAAPHGAAVVGDNGVAVPGIQSSGSTGGAGAGGSAVTLPTTGLQSGEFVGPKVIETAQLSLQTKKGGFDGAFQRANEVAARYHGYIETSSAAGVNTKSGDLTIRVPSQSFQAAIRDLRGLGRVTAQSISGQDVTSQYVDLQSRLRNWQAQEAVLLKLMSRATTIGDTLRVQNELSQVQLRIEELKGQLRVLDNQTSFATIQVSMREIGHVVPPAKAKASGLVQAWRDARSGFIGVLSAVVVGLGYLVPIALLLGLIWLGVRRLWPRVPA